MFCFVLLSATARHQYLRGHMSAGRTLLTFAVPLLLNVAAIVGLMRLAGKAAKLFEFVKEMAGVDLWPFLRVLTIRQVTELVKSRATSLIALSSSIFMK